MPHFDSALGDWGSDAFAETLKHEIEGLEPGILPLLQGSSRGGVPDESEIKAMVLQASEGPDSVHARVGIFFNEILAGCSCGDEPMSLQSYCEMQVDIDKTTAEARFTVLGG